jgi:hypothetical protein
LFFLLPVPQTYRVLMFPTYPLSVVGMFQILYVLAFLSLRQNSGDD